MLAKFNPTGTHVHKGFLKVRIDLYPDIGDKTYPIHHILVPVIPPEGYPGAVDNEGNPPEMNVTDEYKGLKEQSTSSLGKHIIVNDKKIINDPKLMAEAVRTMMNKE